MWSFPFCPMRKQQSTISVQTFLQLLSDMSSGKQFLSANLSFFFFFFRESKLTGAGTLYRVINLFSIQSCCRVVLSCLNRKHGARLEGLSLIEIYQRIFFHKAWPHTMEVIRANRGDLEGLRDSLSFWHTSNLFFSQNCLYMTHFD